VGSEQSSGFSAYLGNAARGYWILVGFATVCLVVVYSVPAESVLSVLRYFAGGFLALGLPGFSLVWVLWPEKASSISHPTGVDWVLQLALSIVLSIVVVSLVVGVLDFTPVGVSLGSVALSLWIFTFCFASFGVFRTYRNQKLS
jgi:uncharacterized membrane protein